MSIGDDREIMRQHKANGTWGEYCKSYYAGTPAPAIADSVTDWPRDDTVNMRDGKIAWYAARGE